MERRTALSAVTIGVALMTGCNGRRGGEVVGPSGSVGVQPVSVVSGRTGQPVPSLSGLTATSGQSLNLQASGFFAFRTSFTGSTIQLWPADDGFLTSDHTRHLVYGGRDPGMLYRLPQGTNTVSLVPDAGIRAFPWALARVTKAAETLSQSHKALDFSVDGGGFRVDLIVDFSDPVFTQQPGAAGAAYAYDDGHGNIMRAKVVYRSLQIQGFWHTEDNFETAVVHEVIHTTGLNHSSGAMDPPGIMSDDAKSYGFRAPSELERLIMKMQYDRLPGTTLTGMTESDPGVSARASEPGWHLVCVR
jgi:hypothetical protein